MQSRDKKCGILLAVSSLPGNHGIGCFDNNAYKFIDFLADCKQDYWQILPLCPLGKGNSPYYSPASFAGEPLYIDIEALKIQGLIKEIPEYRAEGNVDYKKVREFKLPLIKIAAKNFSTSNAEYIEFCTENAYWLEAYAEFMTLKDLHGSTPFYSWSENFKNRTLNKENEVLTKNKDKIEFYKITQFFFYSQYNSLKKYANSKGIEIIGDIPFYVSPDSADVWANSKCFKLKEDMSPSLVAGVPPDIFSSDGQLWGNPIYNWEYQRKNKYKWWKTRLFHNSKLYDVLRIDHFRAFADYYAIPSNAKSAKEGSWIMGEGMNFWNEVKSDTAFAKIIAEDLGGETDIVKKLVRDTGFPNMKLLQFAFDSDLSDPFLPQNYNSNCVCYTGTHDNDTTLGWYKKIPDNERDLFHKLTEELQEESPVLRLIEYGMKSSADIVIIPLQDYLELDSDCRLNTPGTDSNNWCWRLNSDFLSHKLIETVKRLCSNRM